MSQPKNKLNGAVVSARVALGMIEDNDEDSPMHFYFECLVNAITHSPKDQALSIVLDYQNRLDEVLEMIKGNEQRDKLASLWDQMIKQQEHKQMKESAPASVPPPPYQQAASPQPPVINEAPKRVRNRK